MLEPSQGKKEAHLMSDTPLSPSERSFGQYAALQEVFDQAVSLFHLLRTLAAQLHGQGNLTAARRGILRSLDRLGPQTVPQMARARPVSRQHIQTEVNELEADGLVELVENVAHKRSRLVRLTPKGKAHLEAMYRREAELLGAVELAIPEDALRSTALVLQELREALLQAQLRVTRGAGQERSAESTMGEEHDV
jgi:DNA-binding MarR family transcriptional regulator